MKKSVPYRQLAGFVFTGLLGTFLHFLFDITKGRAASALVSAVNESIWEHMKLLFYPMVIFAVIEYKAWGKEYNGFWCIKLKGILLGLALIPVIYYTYTGALGVSADWFNITIFFIAAAAAFFAETKLFEREKNCKLNKGAAIFAILLIAAAFTVFTFVTPRLPIFEDPVTGNYGVYRTL